MMVGIGDIIRECLFMPRNPHVIDLDTGKIAPAKEGVPERHLIIPTYTQAYFYQRYFELLQENNVIEIPERLRSYPQYARVDAQEAPGWIDFMEEAHIFCEEDVEVVRWQNLSSDSPRFDKNFPSYNDFLDEFQVRLAREWCAENGIEYDKNMILLDECKN